MEETPNTPDNIPQGYTPAPGTTPSDQKLVNVGGRPVEDPPIDWPLVEKCVTAGLTEWQMAIMLGVHDNTIYNWKMKSPEFVVALKKRGNVVQMVERSLLEKATGYNYESEEIMNVGGVVVREKVIKHVPPNELACIAILNNKDPENWRRSGRGGDVLINNDMRQFNLHVTSTVTVRKLLD